MDRDSTDPHGIADAVVFDHIRRNARQHGHGSAERERLWRGGHACDRPDGGVRERRPQPVADRGGGNEIGAERWHLDPFQRAHSDALMVLGPWSLVLCPSSSPQSPWSIEDEGPGTKR